MQNGACPELHANYPKCGCAEGECEAFDEFGLACDNCDTAGHRDTDEWVTQPGGYVWCTPCHISECGTDAAAMGMSPPHFSVQPPLLSPDPDGHNPKCDTHQKEPCG